MRVAVLGLSDFGYPLAIRLHEVGNEVIAVAPGNGEMPLLVPGSNCRIGANATGGRRASRPGTVVWEQGLVGKSTRERMK